jgi:hypothetical protein
MFGQIFDFTVNLPHIKPDSYSFSSKNKKIEMGKEHPKVRGKVLDVAQKQFYILLILITLVRYYAQEKVEDVYSIPFGLGTKPRLKR